MVFQHGLSGHRAVDGGSRSPLKDNREGGAARPPRRSRSECLPRSRCGTDPEGPGVRAGHDCGRTLPHRRAAPTGKAWIPPIAGAATGPASRMSPTSSGWSLRRESDRQDPNFQLPPESARSARRRTIKHRVIKGSSLEHPLGCRGSRDHPNDRMGQWQAPRENRGVRSDGPRRLSRKREDDPRAIRLGRNAVPFADRRVLGGGRVAPADLHHPRDPDLTGR